MTTPMPHHAAMENQADRAMLAEERAADGDDR